MSRISRRNFLSVGAAAAAAFAASPALAAADGADVEGKGRPAPIRLGLASNTFRNFSRADLIACMKQLRDLDLNARDSGHLPRDPAREAAALADYAANGISLHAVGTISFQEDSDEDIRAKFEYAKRAEVRVIVAGYPAPEALPRIEKLVKQFDISFAIHNHGPEDKAWPTPKSVLNAVKQMDSRMGCCIDVGHTVRAGADVMEAVYAAGPRLFNMHMKDLTDFHDEASQVPVGQGRMPVREIFRSLAAIRYPGFVDLEYEVNPENPMPGAIASFAYMRGVLAGLGCVSCG